MSASVAAAMAVLVSPLVACVVWILLSVVPWELVMLAEWFGKACMTAGSTSSTALGAGSAGVPLDIFNAVWAVPVVSGSSAVIAPSVFASVTGVVCTVIIAT